MNNSNDKKTNFGETVLKAVVYIVILNTAVSACVGSHGTQRADTVSASAIYDEIKVVGPVADTRRVRIKKRTQEAADVSQAAVIDFTESPLNTPSARFVPWPSIQTNQFGQIPLASAETIIRSADESSSVVLICREDNSACLLAYSFQYKRFW